MTTPQLKACVRYWQQVLRLDNWDISVQFVGQNALDSLAHTEIDEFHLRARVSIVNPDELAPGSLSHRETEHLVVHELLHVRLAPDGQAERTPEALAMEQGINRIAELLLYAKRSKVRWRSSL